MTPDQAMLAYSVGWIGMKEFFEYVEPTDVLRFIKEKKISQKTAREYFGIRGVDRIDFGCYG